MSLRPSDLRMGRIIARVRIGNVTEPNKNIQCDALVDTGASHMVLPSSWRERLAPLETLDVVKVETATQDVVEGEMCGPVRIQIDGFRPIFSEVLFVDMHPSDSTYEPLIGYLVLEASQAAVDLIGHRLAHIRHLDLKITRNFAISFSGR